MDTKYTVKQLNLRISNIRMRVKSNYEHETAMDTVRHAFNNGNGDITLFTKLCVALLGPSGRRRAGLNMIVWGKEYFPLVVKQDEETKVLSISLKKNRSNADWKFDEAGAHPFDEATEKEADSVILGTEALLKIVSSFANKDNTTPEAHALAKIIEGEINTAMGRTPEAVEATAEAA